MDAEIALVLISNGAKVNAKSNDGLTPLHVAVYHGKIEIINLLVSKGADIDARDNNGFTPLHMAVGRGNIEIAKILVGKGSNVYAKGNQGHTLLDIAKKVGDAVILQYLAGILVLDEGFLDILTMIVDKYGKGPLLDIGICRAYVSDYAKRDYKKESQCLFKAVEAGVPRAILGSDYANLQLCLEQQHKKLQEKMNMDSMESLYIVNILGQIMRGVWLYG
jgi:hypothetical protein